MFRLAIKRLLIKKALTSFPTFTCLVETSQGSTKKSRNKGNPHPFMTR